MSLRTAFPSWLARTLLKSAFDLLYHPLAPVYDAVSWVVSGGQWREWQRASIQHLPTGRVLEIGPGPGHLLVDLLASGRDAYGLERSPDMLRIATRRLESSGYPGRLVAGDARRLPFGEASFDGVVLTFPAPFLDRAFWREVERVLRPGGALVVVLGAESGGWPWPGALERSLARLRGGTDLDAAREMVLAPELAGRLVDQPVGRGVAHMILARRRESAGGGSSGEDGGG